MKDEQRIRELFETAKAAVDEIALILKRQEMGPQDTPEETRPAVKRIEGNTAPWVLKAHEFFGMDEKDNHAQLSALMGGIDPEQTPWCAHFVSAVLRECGLSWNSSGVAAEYQNYGAPCEKQNGAIAVFDGHVGFVVNDTKILGGNQGDMVKENNLAWYEQNKQLLGYRCPEGYELT